MSKNSVPKISIYGIIKSITKGFAKAAFFVATKAAGIKRRRHMKRINVISKDELADLIDISRLKELTEKVSNIENIIPSFAKKEEVVVVEEKKKFPWKAILCIIGIVAAVCGVAFLIYRYFNDDYEDEFLDDIDDEFDDDDDEIFEDDN